MMSKQLISRGFLFQHQRRAFAALNSAHLDRAISSAESGSCDWSSFFSGLSPADVHDSDVRTVGRLLKALSLSANAPESADQEALYSAIDTYFKKQFRKLSAKDAVDVLIPLGENAENKLACMDEKFWFWETVEESLRPNIDSLNVD